jgi:hypothetical protein
MSKPQPKNHARTTTLGLRLSAEEGARLDAIVERVPIASRHSIARAALRIGLDALEADITRLVSHEREDRGARTR